MAGLTVLPGGQETGRQWDSLFHQNSAEMIKLSSCCLLRAHQGLLVGGAGRDLGVGDPSVLHAEREGAVGGDHWDWGGQEGHNLRVSRE